MGLVQAMTFSFLERVGSDRGFSLQAITSVLIALGFVNLFPAALAALLERTWPARTGMIAGPVVQALLAGLIMNTAAFGPYTAAASVFVAVMIFTHTFAFSVMSRMDQNGRAMAATPRSTQAFASSLGPA